MISELTITEVLSAVARRRRAGAERLLFHIQSVTLRTLDALHVAAAFQGSATYIVTYDVRMQAAALHAGLKTIEP